MDASPRGFQTMGGQESYLLFPDEQCHTTGCFFEQEFRSGMESDDGAPLPQSSIYATLDGGIQRTTTIFGGMLLVDPLEDTASSIDGRVNGPASF